MATGTTFCLYISSFFFFLFMSLIGSIHDLECLYHIIDWVHEILQSDKIASINLGRETKWQRKFYFLVHVNGKWKYTGQFTWIDDCDSQTNSKRSIETVNYSWSIWNTCEFINSLNILIFLKLLSLNIIVIIIFSAANKRRYVCNYASINSQLFVVDVLFIGYWFKIVIS